MQAEAAKAAERALLEHTDYEKSPMSQLDQAIEFTPRIGGVSTE